MRRGVFLLGVAAAVSCAMMFAACGIDETGLLSADASQDGTLVDGHAVDASNDNFVGPDVLQDTYVPPACATLDASCVPGFPAGWIPVGAVIDPITACPGDSEDFQSTDWIANPMYASGACACSGCATSGTWSCGGLVTVAVGTNCPTSSPFETFDAAPHCSELSATSGGGLTVVSGSTPTLEGSPTCSTFVSGNRQINTQAVRTCLPLQCDTDYCGVTSAGFHLCILYNGAAACPSGFMPLQGVTNGLITSDANVGGSCETCTCSVNTPGQCKAALHVYAEAGCDNDSGGTMGTDYEGQYALVDGGGCQNNIVEDINSVYYLPAPPPTASCSETDGGTGVAIPLSPNTVCCAQ